MISSWREEDRKHPSLIHWLVEVKAKYPLGLLMDVNHQVVLEYDPETKSYTATVPGLPVVVDADTEEEALRLATEGIAFCLQETSSRKRSKSRLEPVQTRAGTRR